MMVCQKDFQFFFVLMTLEPTENIHAYKFGINLEYLQPATFQSNKTHISVLHYAILSRRESYVR